MPTAPAAAIGSAAGRLRAAARLAGTRRHRASNAAEAGRRRASRPWPALAGAGSSPRPSDCRADQIQKRDRSRMQRSSSGRGVQNDHRAVPDPFRRTVEDDLTRRPSPGRPRSGRGALYLCRHLPGFAVSSSPRPSMCSAVHTGSTSHANHHAHDLRARPGLTAALSRGIIRHHSSNARSRSHGDVDRLTWSPLPSTVSAINTAHEACS